MKEKTIYFLFTDTGTYLSRMINFFTRQSLNHVSICFDKDLKEVYSFGRIHPRNPFSGGFVREDIRGDFLKNAQCAVYKFQISDSEYNNIVSNIKRIENESWKYKYNFLGLLGILLQIEIERKYALFCSQFVATVMRDSESFQLKKPVCFTTPADIREHIGMQLIYRGKLGAYRNSNPQIIETKSVLSKSSFIFLLSKKVKQFVIR